MASRKAFRDQVARIVRKWQHRLGLDSWAIAIDITNDLPEERYAETHRMNIGMRARIVVHKDAFLHPADDLVDHPNLERTLIHELVHILLTHFSMTADDALSTYVGGTLGRAVQDRLEIEEERLCDLLSISLLENWR